MEVSDRLGDVCSTFYLSNSLSFYDDVVHWSICLLHRPDIIMVAPLTTSKELHAETSIDWTEKLLCLINVCLRLSLAELLIYLG